MPAMQNMVGGLPKSNFIEVLLRLKQAALSLRTSFGEESPDNIGYHASQKEGLQSKCCKTESATEIYRPVPIAIGIG